MYEPSLWRVPLILLSSYSCYVSITPPQPPATAAEKAGYEERGWFSAVAVTPVWILSHGFQIFFHGMNILDLVHIYSHWYLPINAGHGPLSFALPFDFVVGVALLAGSSYIRTLCYRALGRYFTFELALKKDHELITDGPYSYARHPGYGAALVGLVGSVLTLMGPSSYWVAKGTWHTASGKVLGTLFLSYGMLWFVVIMARVRKEDKILRATFGQKWTVWAKTTPYKLIPCVY